MSGLGASILEEGLEQGIEQGRANQLVSSVENLVKSLNLSVADVCKALNVELCEYENAKELIEKLVH